MDTNDADTPTPTENAAQQPNTGNDKHLTPQERAYLLEFLQQMLPLADQHNPELAQQIRETLDQHTK